MNRVKGKLILVTGASSGIGEACARRFAAEGADLILWARRADRLERLAAELGTAHRVSLSLAQVDVRDRAAVNRAVEALVRGGRVPDVLINNAGLASGLAKIHEGDPEDWDRMIDTNLKGLLYVSRAIMPHMVARRRGHVVNIGSIAGHQTYPMGNVYNATKFGVRALTEGMNLDVAGTPIRVSAVDPGLVETEFSEVRFHGDKERAAAVYQGLKPLSADDVADAIAYIVNLPEHVNILDLVLVASDMTNSLLLLFNTAEGENYSVFAIDSTSGATHTIVPEFVLDTGAVPPAGHGRLRIANFAAAAPAIDAHRTQPDSPGLVVTAQPLNFRAVTRYFDGAAGDWSVVISPAGMTDTLLATGSIPIADGQARTVVVLDSTVGHVTWRLVPDRN